jgi:hypothetical protein
LWGDKEKMPSLPFVAELTLSREFDNLLEIEFLYTGFPAHSEKVIRQLERVCTRLLRTQIPAVYEVEEDVGSCLDPAMTDVVVRRDRLTDNQVVWLKNHLRRGFEKRALCLNVLSQAENVHAIEKKDGVRWVRIPESGYEQVARRAVQESKASRRKMSSKCRKKSKLSM